MKYFTLIAIIITTFCHSQNNKYDYKTEFQQIEEEVWDQIDAYDQNLIDQKVLITNIEDNFSKIKNAQQKDAITVDILKSIGKDLSTENAINLFTLISDNRKLVSALNSILVLRKEDDKKKIKNYVISRLNKMNDIPLKSQLFIDSGKIFASNNILKPNTFLSNLHKTLSGNIDKKWAIDGTLELASIYQSMDDFEKSISVLDQLTPHAFEISDKNEKLILISHICDAYVSSKANKRALSILQKASNEELDLTTRLLSQRVLNQNNDYNTSKEFIDLIKSPVQRFLGLESWLSQASHEKDIERIKEATKEIIKLTPNLPKAIDKFNAYIVLTHAYQTLGNDKLAQEKLGIAESLLVQIPNHLLEDSKMRVKILKKLNSK